VAFSCDKFIGVICAKELISWMVYAGWY